MQRNTALINRLLLGAIICFVAYEFLHPCRQDTRDITLNPVLSKSKRPPLRRQDPTSLIQNHQPALTGAPISIDAMHAPPVGSTAPAPWLLVLVISSHGPLYATHRAVWRLLAAAAPPDVRVYFLYNDPSASAISIADNCITFPGSESLIPGVLMKTIASLNLLLGPKAPPHGYKWILRTNLSSFWAWDRLLRWIVNNLRPPVHAGVRIEYTTSLSGAGNIMSLDVAQKLLKGNASLDYTLIDDLAIGSYTSAIGVPRRPMTRANYTPAERHPNCMIPKKVDVGAYHYRVKAAYNREVYDGCMLSRLFSEIYGRADPVN